MATAGGWTDAPGGLVRALSQQTGDMLSHEDEPMPPSWTDKDERQYEHVKEGALDRGTSEDRAEEIAARTVNKQRRSEGRTPNERTAGTGNPNTELEERTRDELYNRARELKVEGRSKMTKSELIEAIRERNQTPG